MKTQLALWRCIKAGDVFYDIGANVGFYTLLGGGRVGVAGRIYSFEPLPENIAHLKRHIVLNHLTNCEGIEAAVSDVDGFAQFDSSRPRSMGWLSETGDQTVRTVCLDSLVTSKRIRPPRGMKIDVEGDEARALPVANRSSPFIAQRFFLPPMVPWPRRVYSVPSCSRLQSSVSQFLAARP